MQTPETRKARDTRDTKGTGHQRHQRHQRYGTPNALKVRDTRGTRGAKLTGHQRHQMHQRHDTDTSEYTSETPVVYLAVRLASGAEFVDEKHFCAALQLRAHLEPLDLRVDVRALWMGAHMPAHTAPKTGTCLWLYALPYLTEQVALVRRCRQRTLSSF